MKTQLRRSYSQQCGRISEQRWTNRERVGAYNEPRAQNIVLVRTNSELGCMKTRLRGTCSEQRGGIREQSRTTSERVTSYSEQCGTEVRLCGGNSRLGGMKPLLRGAKVGLCAREGALVAQKIVVSGK